ncbi:uncharacterized protein B0I36DRAFT_346524 [Microdochium trichocladiopsis]|uniref:Ecp2 effector protein domain-containing protein n=1 Tax=Microdochium trichocladiopsis TaxID=1682393 RepID=A0A9P8Y9X9_9PEZI|nr:uncharacterized protein B0I36DRAFT_346524 [Microdochium trichocladiopsis]KAH7034613.1 hypothetical protein B0I36DRAFT_346524 [Microdochium trichocladiopsis]
MLVQPFVSASTALLSAASVFLFSTPVKANFDVYRTEIIWGNRPSIVWQFWEAQAPNDCPRLFKQPLFEELNNKPNWDSLWGVKCTGSGCSPLDPPGNIDELRLKLNREPLLDWTLSKNRGWSMIGRDGNSYGDCMVFPQGDVTCWFGGYHIQSRRKFRCLSRFTADDLNRPALGGRDLADENADSATRVLTGAMTFEQFIGKEYGTSPAGLEIRPSVL